jgi:hypothetical protein
MVDGVPSERERRPGVRGGQEGDPASEEDRDDRRLHAPRL